jgi:hypothetical protein
MPSPEDDSTGKEDLSSSAKIPEPTKIKKGKKASAAKAKPTTTKKKRRHKPKDFPKRPLSAYNIFFKETREKILADNEGKKDIAFQTMAKEIASRWKDLDPKERERVGALAKEDMKRYREEVKNYEEEMVKRSRKEREDAENLRRMQAAEKAEEEAAANESAALANGHGPTSDAMNGYGAGSLGVSSLEHQISHGGLEFDALRREQIQMRLLEELRSVEARAMQVRQLQAQLGFPTEGGGGGLGGDLLGRHANSLFSSMGSSMGRDQGMSDYELLLRQRAAAGLVPGGGGGGLSSMGGGGGLSSMAGLMGFSGAGSGLGGLGGGLGGGLNAGLLAQLQGLGGLQSGYPSAGGEQGNFDIQSLLQHQQELMNRGGNPPSANPPY